MVVTAESGQERGLSAGMSDPAAAHVETVGGVRREKSARPDDGTKFENSHKYYKRTKDRDSRADLNDGMGMVCPVVGWQLEALHGLARAACPVAPPATAVGVPGMVGGPLAVRPLAELPRVGAMAGMGTPLVGGNLSFSTSDTEDYSYKEDSDAMGEGRKGSSDGGAVAGAGSGNMTRFFEGLTKQVMERQEAMQQRFEEAIEKREQDRMIREEAWRRQGMARLAREQEILAQERAMAATRGAAVLSILQKITGQTIAAPGITFMPTSSQTHATPIAYAAAPPPSWQPPACTRAQPSQLPPKMAPATPQPQQQEALVLHQVRNFMTPAETPRDGPGDGGRGGASSSPRWTKVEVHALIQLRSHLLDMQYREAGPKGPIWEEISAGMRRMGYSRSSKNCREKWNNMDKYFKTVKESNKKRPKTCPDYFHHLDALYRSKAALGYPSVGALPPLAAEHANAAPQDRIQAFTVAAPISQRAPPPHTMPPVAKNGVTKYDGNGHGVSGEINLEQPPTGTTAGDGKESTY